MEKGDYIARTIRFDRQQFVALEAITDERGVTLAEVVRQAVDVYLNVDQENRQLKSLLNTEIDSINIALLQQREMLYASISGAAMLSAMILERETGESDANFTSRKHSRVDRTILDAMELGKWLVDGYQKLKKESSSKR